MEHALSSTETTFLAEATVAKDGSLHLVQPLTALKPGEKVLLSISRPRSLSGNSTYLLRGTVIRYDDPFAPAVPADDWDAVR